MRNTNRLQFSVQSVSSILSNLCTQTLVRYSMYTMNPLQNGPSPQMNSCRCHAGVVVAAKQAICHCRQWYDHFWRRGRQNVFAISGAPVLMGDDTVLRALTNYWRIRSMQPTRSLCSIGYYSNSLFHTSWLVYHDVPVYTDNLEPLAQKVFDPNHPATTNMMATTSADENEKNRWTESRLVQLYNGLLQMTTIKNTPDPFCRCPLLSRPDDPSEKGIKRG